MNIIKSESTQPSPPDRNPSIYAYGSWDSPQQLDFHRLWKVIVRRKWGILLVILAVVIPTAVYSFLATPLYRSTVTIQVDPESAKVVPYSDVSEGYVNALRDFELYMKTKDVILKSPTLIRRTTRRLQEAGVAKSPVLAEELANFDRHLGIQRIEGSQVITVSHSSSDPQFAAVAVNTFVEEFIKLHFEDKSATTNKATKFLEKELDNLKLKLQTAERELFQYASKNEIPDPQEGEANVVLQRFEFFSKRLSEIESQFMKKRAEYNGLKAASLSNFPEGLRSASIVSFEDQLLKLEQDLSQLQSQFGENWPEVRRKREDIEFAKKQLNKMKQAAITESLEQVRSEYKTAQNEYEMVREAVNQQKAIMNRLNEASIRYNILKREVDTNQELYQSLLQRLKETGVTSGLEFSNIHIIDRGRPALRPYSPQMTRSLPIAFALGLFLGVGFAFLIEFLDNKIHSSEDVEELGLWSLGVIPKFNAKKHLRTQSRTLLKEEQTSIIPLSRQHPAAQEAFYGLTASILLSKSDRPPGTILLTSSVPSEGKSTTATYLARLLAADGARTILLDCDLRNHSITSRLGFTGVPGLSTYLSGNNSSGLIPHIRNAGISSLYMMPSGPKPPNPVSLLRSETLKGLLEELAKDFTYVIIDSPPILSVADAWLMSPYTDGVVLVAKAGFTSRKMLLEATKQVHRAGGNLLGVVINSADLRDSQYRYYRQYYQSHSERSEERDSV